MDPLPPIRMKLPRLWPRRWLGLTSLGLLAGLRTALLAVATADPQGGFLGVYGLHGDRGPVEIPAAERADLDRVALVEAGGVDRLREERREGRPPNSAVGAARLATDHRAHGASDWLADREGTEGLQVEEVDSRWNLGTGRAMEYQTHSQGQGETSRQLRRYRDAMAGFSLAAVAAVTLGTVGGADRLHMRSDI